MLNVRIRRVEKRTTRANDKKKSVIRIPDLHKSESTAAKNYMFRYKIGRARRRLTMSNGVYNYGVNKCPDWSPKKKTCPRGNGCRFAHGALESLFHPLFYKTSLCTREACEQGEDCAWAHANEEIRVLRTVLGRDWVHMDPVSAQESRKARKERRREERKRREAEQLRKARKVKLIQPTRDGDAESVRSSMSVVSSARPERTASPWCIAEKMSVASTPSGGSSTQAFDDDDDHEAFVHVHVEDVEEEEKTEEKEAEVEESASTPLVSVVQENKTTISEASREFAFWFESVFDIGCEDLPHGGYLRRFMSSGLDDVQLLWGLYLTMPDKLVNDLLVNEIGMENGVTRDLFLDELRRYVCPEDVCEWMDRVVGLPQYSDLFEMGETMEELVFERLDDGGLAEMGISSASHRMKILYYLGKFEGEMRQMEVQMAIAKRN